MLGGNLCCNRGAHLLPFLTVGLVGGEERKELLGNGYVGQQSVAGQERLDIVCIPSPFQRKKKETSWIGESQR